MTDIVVTVPRATWADWLKQHGTGAERGRMRSFHVYDQRGKPPASEGDHLYVVSHGRLRCVLLIENIVPFRGGWFIQATMMRGVTVAGYVPGFKGWQRRWWDPQHELPFDAWRSEAVSATATALEEAEERGAALAPYAHGKTRSEQGGASA